MPSTWTTETLSDIAWWCPMSRPRSGLSSEVSGRRGLEGFIKWQIGGLSPSIKLPMAPGGVQSHMGYPRSTVGETEAYRDYRPSRGAGWPDLGAVFCLRSALTVPQSTITTCVTVPAWEA